MKIREAEKDDAKELLVVFKKLDAETKFMLFEPGERKTSIVEQEDTIQRFKESLSKIVLLAVDDKRDEIVGVVIGIGNELKRNRHVLSCVIGVLQEFTGNGVGSSLLLNLEAWARKSGVHRLELTVMEHNERAKKLYQKFGFQAEGVKRNSLKMGGRYVNEILMSKLI